MSLFQRRSTSANEPAPARPPFEGFYIYAALALVAFFVADTILTAIRGDMLPSQAPPARIGRAKEIQVKSRNDYQAITQRNPFNSDGVIPPPLSNDGEGETDDSAPVLSQLPLTLVGTIVHVDPKRSVATIQNRSKSLNEQFLAYRVDDEIKGMARILVIERKKVIFRNLNNNRKEYIEIKDESTLRLGLQAAKPPEEVQQEGNRFILKRDDVNKYTSNLPELLQQARAVPNIIPGSGGQVDGFRLLEIDEGSIFEKLGLKKMDVIKGVNGEPVNSPAKAMELYNELKSSNRIDIEIERNGRTEQLNYLIE